MRRVSTLPWCSARMREASKFGASRTTQLSAAKPRTREWSLTQRATSTQTAAWCARTFSPQPRWTKDPCSRIPPAQLCVPPRVPLRRLGQQRGADEPLQAPPRHREGHRLGLCPAAVHRSVAFTCAPRRSRESAPLRQHGAAPIVQTCRPTMSVRSTCFRSSLMGMAEWLP